MLGLVVFSFAMRTGAVPSSSPKLAAFESALQEPRCAATPQTNLTIAIAPTMMPAAFAMTESQKFAFALRTAATISSAWNVSLSSMPSSSSMHGTVPAHLLYDLQVGFRSVDKRTDTIS